jgi:hypothetical protein
MADLIILAFVIAFVCVATLGHLMVGAALLVGTGQKPSESAGKSRHAAAVADTRAANDPQPSAGKLAA